MMLRERIEKWAGRRHGAIVDFANELKISHASVSGWCAPDPSQRPLPSETIRPKICALLEITMEELLGYFPVQKGAERGRGSSGVQNLQMTNMTTAPVVTEISRGGFQFMFNAYAEEWLPATMAVPAGRRFAWAKVVSDVLGDYAPADSYLGVVEATENELANGQMIIVNLGRGCTIGRFKRLAGDYVEVVHPTDKAQSVKMPQNSLNVVGRVVGLLIKRQ
jgi:hypothetical protein